ncbi:MAG TPA: UDP binding domain-containing protein, partial [Terracidiphilus sp.]|nr:UDP binding domain-containing protein [Terracidiphilus sp.]
VIRQLLHEGSVIAAYDPAASERAKEVIPPAPNMTYADDPYAAAQDADALLILNEWQEFAELDLKRLHYTLRYPIVIDGRNLYHPAKMLESGFTYLSVGRPGLSHTRDAAVGQRLH